MKSLRRSMLLIAILMIQGQSKINAGPWATMIWGGINLYFGIPLVLDSLRIIDVEQQLRSSSLFGGFRRSSEPYLGSAFLVPGLLLVASGVYLICNSYHKCPRRSNSNQVPLDQESQEL